MDPAGKQCYEKSLVFLGLNKWMDSKAVHMLSKFSALHPVKQVKRRIKGYKNKDAVKCPLVIQQHNKYMGEVDIMDQKKNNYQFDHRSKNKSYLRRVYDILDIAINNAGII